MIPRHDGAWTRPGWLIILSLGLAGCNQEPPPVADPATRFRGIKLEVGVVGDPALLKSIAAQRGEWVARTGSELIIHEGTIDPKAVPATVDIVVFAGEQLGDLVATGALAVLPESVVQPPVAPEPPADPEAKAVKPIDSIKFADVVSVYRDQVSKYGPDRYGLPIGGSALVIAFRRPAFTNSVLIAAAQAAGLTLEPPRTWDQLDALARFFHGRDIDDDGQPDSGVALAWGADPEGVGNALFLARTATSALHPDQFSFLLDSETTEPRVTSPPFVAALRALVALQAAGPPGGANFDAAAARAAFKSGRVAMLIDRAEMAGTWGTGRTPIGVAPLPGSAQVFDPSRAIWESSGISNQPHYLPTGGGWLVGVTTKSSQRAAAEEFARYLAGFETTDRLRAERDFPMLAVRTTQLTQGMVNPRSAPGVEARPWADAVAKTLTADKVVPGLRVPDAAGYLADLSTARVAAAAGKPVEDALQGLAVAWSERTRKAGIARQTWHHRRSLNGPSTAPTPPG